MATLNSLAARIANMLGQPYNIELKERAKSMVKDLFANRIRQSIQKSGIDDQLKLTFAVPIENINIKDIIGYNRELETFNNVLGTRNKIPVPIRVSNDAPFMDVFDKYGNRYTYISDMTSHLFRAYLFPTGAHSSYTLVNNHLIIIKSSNTIEVTDKRNIDDLLITGIWRDPEEVLTMYQDDDGQDIEIPFPADMFTNIIYEILRTEFNTQPKELDIKLNEAIGGQ